MLIKQLLRPAAHAYWKLANGLDVHFGKRGKQIIICGYPRSGTSLIYNMLAASIDGFRCEEYEMEAIHRLHRRGNYVTKFPLDILNIDEILRNNILSKDVFFLLLVRDVRDLITSKHPLVPDRYFIGYKNSLWPEDPNFAKWNSSAPGIEAIHDAMRACTSRRDVKFLKIRYENLVTDTGSIQTEVERLLGIRFPESFADYYKRPDRHAYRYSGRYEAKDPSLARENARVDKNRISKWKSPEHRDVLLHQFSQHPELFQILIEEGYERDASWFNSLRTS